MAKAKELKLETVRRLDKLIKMYGENVKESKEYDSLYTHYTNAYEKDNMESIIDLVERGLDYDEIALILKGELEKGGSMKETKKNATLEAQNNEVNAMQEEQADNGNLFLFSEKKVISDQNFKEVEPVDVEIESGDGSAKEFKAFSKLLNLSKKHEAAASNDNSADKKPEFAMFNLLQKINKQKEESQSSETKTADDKEVKKSNTFFFPNCPDSSSLFDDVENTVYVNRARKGFWYALSGR